MNGQSMKSGKITTLETKSFCVDFFKKWDIPGLSLVNVRLFNSYFKTKYKHKTEFSTNETQMRSTK